MKRLLSIQLGLAALLVSSMVMAQPAWLKRKQSLDLAREAKADIQKGDYLSAAKKFKKADELTPAPTYKLGMAKMLVELGDLVQAADILAACNEKPAQQWVEKKAQKICDELAKEVDDKTPTIEIDVFEPSADKVTVEIQGEVVEIGKRLKYNPGSYTIVAGAIGYKDVEKKVELKESDREFVELTLKPEKAKKKEEDEDDSSSGGLSPIPAYVAWGVGGAGLALGVGFGVAAIQTTNEVLRVYECVDEVCPAEAEEDLNVAKTNGNVSTAGFIVGGVGVTLGTILYLLSDDDDDEGAADKVDEEDDDEIEISARPIISPTYIGVSGTF